MSDHQFWETVMAAAMGAGLYGAMHALVVGVMRRLLPSREEEEA